MELITIYLDTNSQLFTWVILPILIMLSRITDQTLGSMRLIFLSKGEKIIAPILGFFEVIIWLVAVAQIMKQLDNVMCYIAYGTGFALGNYIGIAIEEKLSIGNVIVRIIPKKATFALVEELRKHDFGVTTMQAEGKNGEVQIVFTIIRRKQINEVVSIINRYNPNAFYSIEDVRAVKEGIIRKQNSKFIFKRFQWGIRKN